MTKKYLLAALLTCFACGGDERTAESPNETDEADEIATEAEAENGTENQQENAEAEAAPSLEVPDDAPSRTETDRYVIELAAQESYAADTLGQVELRIAGAGEWHVNEAFPFAVRAAGSDGVSLAATSFDKDSASAFSEERITVAIPVTPTVGEHDVAAEVSFAICNPSTCVPTTVALRADVVAE